MLSVKKLIQDGKWARLSLVTKAILPVIINYYNKDKDYCDLASKDIARLSGVCVVSVVHAIDELKDLGLDYKYRAGKRGQYILPIYLMEKE